MTDLKPKTARKPEERERVLSLVIEIMPGQAGEGLIEIYEPGRYEDKELRKLCDQILSQKDWSIEESQILEEINRQLEGGKLLCRGREIDGRARDYAVVEQTEAGEQYLYIPIRAIKPQEGGGDR